MTEPFTLLHFLTFCVAGILLTALYYTLIKQQERKEIEREKTLRAVANGEKSVEEATQKQEIDTMKMLKILSKILRKVSK